MSIAKKQEDISPISSTSNSENKQSTIPNPINDPENNSNKSINLFQNIKFGNEKYQLNKDVWKELRNNRILPLFHLIIYYMMNEKEYSLDKCIEILSDNRKFTTQEFYNETKYWIEEKIDHRYKKKQYGPSVYIVDKHILSKKIFTNYLQMLQC